MIEARLGQHKLDGTYPRVNVRLSLRKAIEIGRLDVRMAHEREIGPCLIVRNNQNDVGRRRRGTIFIRWSGCRQRCQAPSKQDNENGSA